MPTKEPATLDQPEPKVTAPIEDPKPKTVLGKPKGVYATAHFIDNEIPVCSHCGDKESNNCSEGYADDICPMLRVKPKNTL